MLTKIRKHVSQMTTAEIALAENAVRKGIFYPAPHAEDRIAERRVSWSGVRHALETGEVIEVAHDNSGEITVLVRATYKRKDVCVVVGLGRGYICTVFVNDPNDNHRTLNPELYTWNADLTTPGLLTKGWVK